MSDLEFTQFKERVKQLVAIDEIVGERVSHLKRAGAQWKACCPFHQERTPSFVVNPERGTWHCFGACSTGGDAIDFVMRFDGLDFIEALELLAGRVGLELPKRTGGEGASQRKRELEPLHACLEDVAKLYQRCLRGAEGRAALAYLRERGLSDATLDAFGVGFAAEGALRELFRQRGWSLALLEQVGLVKQGQDGRHFEFFRARVMIPIRDKAGRVVGFGARVLDKEASGPKYLNTGETPLFHKGRLVYALDLALPQIRRARHVILVEGYTDVMAFHQAGIGNAVAVLGSSLTEDHAALIRHTGARRVTCFFDGDEAGRKATWRALHGLLPLPLEIDVAVPPEGKDPGDFLADQGPAALAQLLAAPRDWLAFLCEPLRGAPSAKLAEGVGAILELCARLREPVHRDARLAELARLLDLPVEGVREQWAQQAARRPARASAPQRAEPARGSAPAREPAPALRGRPRPGRSEPDLRRRAYEGLLGALLADNSLIPLYEELLAGCGLPELQGVIAALLEAHADVSDLRPIDGARLLTRLDEHPLRGAILGWEERARSADSPAALAADEARYLARRALDEELVLLRGKSDEDTKKLAERLLPYARPARRSERQGEAHG